MNIVAGNMRRSLTGLVCAWMVQFAVTPGVVANGSISPNMPQTVNSGGIVAWASGEWSDRFKVANLLDGNTNTVWIGNPGGSPWHVIVDLGKRYIYLNLRDPSGTSAPPVIREIQSP